jgi:hypothetical protein
MLKNGVVRYSAQRLTKAHVNFDLEFQHTHAFVAEDSDIVRSVQEQLEMEIAKFIDELEEKIGWRVA